MSTIGIPLRWIGTTKSFNQLSYTRNIHIAIIQSTFVSVVSTRELAVVKNPETELNQYLQDMADVHKYPLEKMYAFAKEHFKNEPLHIPRNKIEEIVDSKFRMKSKDHHESRKHKLTKETNVSLFKRLPKAIQEQALKAVSPLSESLSFFSEDKS